MSGKEQLDAPSAPSVEDKDKESLPHSESAAPESTNVATAALEQQKKTKQQTPSASTKGSPERPSTDGQQADRPSARRERKQTAFFQPEIKVETAKLEIKEGQGTKLGDIPNIAFHLSKVTGRDELLEDLHQICYGSKGKLTMRKKEIQAFSGFTADASKLEEKAKGLLSRFNNAHLHRMLDLLDIARSDLKDKDSKMDKVIEFLKAPTQLSDKDLAAKEAQKKAAAAKKRQRKQKEDEQKDTDKPKRAKKANTGAKQSAGEDAEEHSGSDDGDAAAADDGHEQPDTTAEPQQSMPDDEELKKEVLAVLENVDVQEFNIKMLMNSLNTKYKVDLKDKKPMIKAIAIAYCAQQGSQKDSKPASDQ